MAKIVAYCSSPDCKWPILKGDRVWHKGKDLYCNSECLIDSFNPGNKGTGLKVYALYKGEELLASGSIKEISEQTGKTEKYLRFMSNPAYKKRCKPNGNSLSVVRI